MDMFVNPSLSSEDISELRRILGAEIERAQSAVRSLEERMRLETMIRNGLMKMRAEILEHQQTFDRTIERSVVAVYRARTRHPSEMPRMPWISD